MFIMESKNKVVNRNTWKDCFRGIKTDSRFRENEETLWQMTQMVLNILVSTRSQKTLYKS